MASTKSVSLAENSDKSLTEWPTLSDVCSNVKKPATNVCVSKNIKNQKRCKSPMDKNGGYDSSKENEHKHECPNGRGARKKSSSRIKWVPVPITHQPYKKRGNGRYPFDQKSFSDKKNEGSENGYDSGKVGSRGNHRFRNKRGRGFSHNWRNNSEETSRGETENGHSSVLYEAECYYNNALYYDPYLHNMYASALRDKELKNAIRVQIEYYFSEDNLVKDIYIRRKMDNQGYVPLSLISTFHRVRNLTKNVDLIIQALNDSSKLEIAENMKVRPVVDPLKWPLPDSSAVGLRTDVPEFFPGQPYVASVIEAMENLSFNDDNIEQYSPSPDVSLSPDPQMVSDYFPDINTDQNVNGVTFYPDGASPVEQVGVGLNFYSSEEQFVANGDYYSNTPSPNDHGNGFDYYPDQVSNDVIYYTANLNIDEQTPRAAGYYYGSSPDEVLSTGTDPDDQVPNKSPEPTR